MAWHTGVGKREYRKDASAAKRADETRNAIADASDGDVIADFIRRGMGAQDAVNKIISAAAKEKKATAHKAFGLEFFYRSFFAKKVVSFKQWYQTERAREQALERASKEMIGTTTPCLRYERIERVKR